VVVRFTPSVLGLGLLVLIAAFVFVGCGGPAPGGTCVTSSDCADGLACGPLETCEEPRMIDGCRMTKKCQEFGYCLAHEGACRSSDASCKASLYCQSSGYCSVQVGGVGCRVATDTDCQMSGACQLAGKCFAFRGQCTVDPPAAKAAAE